MHSIHGAQRTPRVGTPSAPVLLLTPPPSPQYTPHKGLLESPPNGHLGVASFRAVFVGRPRCGKTSLVARLAGCGEERFPSPFFPSPFPSGHLRWSLPLFLQPSLRACVSPPLRPASGPPGFTASRGRGGCLASVLCCFAASLWLPGGLDGRVLLPLGRNHAASPPASRRLQLGLTTFPTSCLPLPLRPLPRNAQGDHRVEPCGADVPLLAGSHDSLAGIPAAVQDHVRRRHARHGDK